MPLLRTPAGGTGQPAVTCETARPLDISADRADIRRLRIANDRVTALGAVETHKGHRPGVTFIHAYPSRDTSMVRFPVRATITPAPALLNRSE